MQLGRAGVQPLWVAQRGLASRVEADWRRDGSVPEDSALDQDSDFTRRFRVTEEFGQLGVPLPPVGAPAQPSS